MTLFSLILHYPYNQIEQKLLERLWGDSRGCDGAEGVMVAAPERGEAVMEEAPLSPVISQAALLP